MLAGIMDTGAGPNLPKENCLPRAWARHVATMKAPRLQSVANTQLKDKVVIRLVVQLGKKIAKTRFLIVTSLVINMILGTIYINENIDKINFKKNTLKPTSAVPVAMKESVSNSTYMTHKVKI